MKTIDIIARDIPNGAEVLQRIQAHPLLRDRVSISDPDAPIDDADQAAETLKAVFQRRTQLERLPQCNRTIFAATGAMYGFRSILPDYIPPRPTEDLLLEAVLRFADAWEKPNRKLKAVDLPAERVRFLATLAAVMREDLRIKTRHVTALIRQLSLVENELHDSVKQPYEQLRKLILADPDLSELLEIVETYFYGAAKKGVDTKRDNERRLSELTAAAEKKGQVAAEQKARTSLADELHNMVDEVTRLNATKDERKDPR